MPLIAGKRAFLELLRQEGVEILFGNPGTTELPLMDALAVESGPRYVLGLQEGAVMAMAGGYAQASGKLAAVNLHVAPGLGNAMGMLYDAGELCGAEANAAKYLGAEAGFHACTRAVMTHGGYGYAREFHVERYLREVMIARLAPVSRELILCHIAERELGLPKSY